MNLSAVAFALTVMTAWALWAALADVATETIEPTVAMILSYVTSIAIAVGYVAATHGHVDVSGRGVGLALGAGVFAGIGAVSFYAGLTVEPTGVVTTISALYVVIATVLGVAVPGEPMGIRGFVGVLFAVAAVVPVVG